MKLEDIADLATAQGGDNGQVLFSGITVDSRAVRPGDLFAALPGVKTDGAAYAADAVSRGAVAVLAAEVANIADLGVPVIRAADPRRALALISARFYGAQPQTMVAVTGTAGKTSVAAFTRQIFEVAGHAAAAIGTTGVVSPVLNIDGSLTTPDPVALHGLLADLAKGGITHAAMEASSHGLMQRRLDGVRLTAAAFTNLGRDHLDYHPDMDDYFAAKMRLFDTLMAPGQPAVIFADDPWSARAAEVAMNAGLDVRLVGRAGEFIALKRVEHERHRQIAEIEHGGETRLVALPLAGDFQIANALVAAGLAISAGVPAAVAFKALESLKGAPGRLELVGVAPCGAPVYVDYAHKPEALEQVLQAVRPFTTGKVVVAFGCGGDRDAGKRPIMGGIAARLADTVIVTDDNPRSEDPATIRAAILAAAPGALEIGDRRQAIREAVAMLKAGDTLIIAGKGHETGQTAKGVTTHFSDHEEARAALAELAAHKPLWTGAAMVEAMGGRPIGAMPAEVSGISIDTRTLKPGDAFFAIRGENFDGHDFAGAAIAAGASVLVVAEGRLPALGRFSAPMIVVDNVLAALGRLGEAARARSNARILAVTGSAGKTTTKEALRHVLSACGETHASAASFNNHWGVPLTLARMPESAKFGVFEIGMNHPGEITPLVAMVRPHVAIVTLIAAAHLGFFRDLDGIADAKAEIFTGVVEGGHALINRDDARFGRLAEAAKAAGVAHVHGFGTSPQSDVRLLEADYRGDGSKVKAGIFGETVDFDLALPGEHLAMNALAVLGAAKLCDADLGTCIAALAKLTAGAGRGETLRLKVDAGVVTVIDESYNANPASMRAALKMLNLATPGDGGRRIAVLGDMRELGERSATLHGELAEPVTQAGVDVMHLCGDEMAALEARMAGVTETHRHRTAEDVATALMAGLRAGDVVMIKGSNGVGLARVVKMLREAMTPA